MPISFVLPARLEQALVPAERGFGPYSAERNMICLTRLNGQQFVINADKIRYVESTPDTLVCCDTGDKVMVKETLVEVTQRAIEYARMVRRPMTD